MYRDKSRFNFFASELAQWLLFFIIICSLNLTIHFKVSSHPRKFEFKVFSVIHLNDLNPIAYGGGGGGAFWPTPSVIQALFKNPLVYHLETL